MALLSVKARLECDGCRTQFYVDIDPAWKAPKSVADLVDDAINGVAWCSIQGEHHLCGSCTKTVDDASADDAQPTYDEVVAILNKKAGV